MQHGGMAGMQHGAEGMGGMAPADPATEKLLLLAAELVRDPAVQQRIQRDPVLRNRWQDEGVRQVLLSRP